MESPTPPQIRAGAKAVEFLHLAFLQVLSANLDPARYVLKGGANLRLFYGSPRRSQDIDLDVVGEAGWSIEQRVDQALAARAFQDFLRLAGISMTTPTKSRQTATTRRWKFSVQGPGGFLHTKIEFSARGRIDPERSLEVLSPTVGRDVGLRAIRVQRYLPPAAIRQKITALAERSQTEPRDVFDLDLLFGRYPNAIERGAVDPEIVMGAIESMFAIDYAAYDELVVAYLEDEFLEIYRRPEVWDEMVLKVTGALEALR
jgi:hypothetical protein